MLFSHPQVAELMSRSFECAWESVRPVPRATIDFGNGRTLERTLHGNIVTYLCTGAGEVVDLVPGLVDPAEYVRRLERVQRLFRSRVFAGPGTTGQLAAPPQDDPWRKRVADLHAATAAGASMDEVQASIPDRSKARIERRLDQALLPPLAAGDAEALGRDSEYNRRHRYPLASELWLERPFARPAELTGAVYRRVLGVDLDDPYLGLAPLVLGGDGGRS